MEINNLNTNIISTYKTMAKSGSAKAKTAETSRAGENVDKVEFDFSRYLNSAKASMASRVDAEANTSRIEELQAKYAGESCPVSADDVADAIVSD